MIALEQAISLILAKRDLVSPSRSLLVGLSGIDGSGKGYLARHIATALRSRGFGVASLAADDWAAAPELRFDPDRPAEHFYEHGFRFEEMFRELVLPLKAQRSRRLEALRSNESQSALHPHVLWIQWWSRPDPGGQYTRTMFIDITERVLMEREKARLEAQNAYLQEEIRSEHNFDEIVGSSPALMEVLRQVEQIARIDSTVLILGETGTGKELVARAIHDRSPRKDRPLVKVNCGAISAGLVESELFGHIKGAFTGAISNRDGRFKLADGGTIFLDEVGELPMDTQVKLLRVLQEQEFEPIGSSRTIKVNVRVVAATNRDLEELVREGKFPADLFYRLNVVPLRVLAEKLRAPAPLPGSSRREEVQTSRFERDHSFVTSAVPEKTDGSLEDVERCHIETILNQTNWMIEGERGAAKMLNLNPSTLRSRMQKLKHQTASQTFCLIGGLDLLFHER